MWQKTAPLIENETLWTMGPSEREAQQACIDRREADLLHVNLEEANKAHEDKIASYGQMLKTEQTSYEEDLAGETRLPGVFHARYESENNFSTAIGLFNLAHWGS